MNPTAQPSFWDSIQGSLSQGFQTFIQNTVNPPANVTPIPPTTPQVTGQLQVGSFTLSPMTIGLGVGAVLLAVVLLRK